MTENLAHSNSSITKRSIYISGHRTSISLEQAFWIQLKEICTDKGVSINECITQIDNRRIHKSEPNLSSAIRVFILNYIQKNEKNNLSK